MASLFGARRRRSPEEDSGSDEDVRSASGKVSRRRLSPEETTTTLALAPNSAAETPSRSPRWLAGIIYGAGRLISSVFASSEEQDDADDDDELISNENEDAENMEESKAMKRSSESKLAIEQLLMKETFSRDECDKMIKIIQSRVVDYPSFAVREHGTPNEPSKRTADAAHDFTGAWRSLNKNMEFFESVPFSSRRFGGFSPGSPFQASPELCNATVLEAKKWLEEKKQGSSSKNEDYGPCTLNTDMLHSSLEADEGSPVDLAKSYMQSLPPWNSPFLGTVRYKTSPFSGVNLFKDKITSGTSDYSLPSSKVAKRDYFSTGFLESLEETRRARLWSSGNSVDIPKFRHFGSTTRLFENENSKISSATHEKGEEPLGSNQGAASLQANELVGVTAKLSRFEGATEEVRPAKGSSLPNTDSPEPKLAKPLDGQQSSGPDVPTKDGNDGVVESLQTEKQDNRKNLAHECLSASKEHPGDALCGAETVTPKTVKSAMSLTNAAANHDGRNSQAVTPEPEVHISSDLNLDSDLRPQDGDPQVQSVVNGSTKKTSANGPVDPLNGNSGVESSGNDNPSCTNSSNAVPITDNNETVSEPAADATGEPSSAQNGTKMKSIERMLTEPKPNYVRRGRKRVVKGARGRGK